MYSLLASNAATTYSLLLPKLLRNVLIKNKRIERVSLMGIHKTVLNGTAHLSLIIEAQLKNVS